MWLENELKKSKISFFHVASGSIIVKILVHTWADGEWKTKKKEARVNNKCTQII